MMASPAAAFRNATDPRGLLSVLDLSLEDVRGILSSASTLDAESPEKRSRRLKFHRVALLFYEASTRTRTSFELAAKSLGAETTLVSALSSSIEKGESLKDTGLNLRALGCEAIVLRHPNSGAAEMLARFTGLPVLNAGDGMHEHPSQALLDLRTLLFTLGLATAKKTPHVDATTLRGLTITICGDIFHSRVARSNALLLPRLGARVLLCGPETLLPALAEDLLPREQLRAGFGEKPHGEVIVRRDFDTCLRESHIVMMLRIQRERLSHLQLDLNEFTDRYQLNEARMPMLGSDAKAFGGGKKMPRIVMHPGPIVRGLELTAGIADAEDSVILNQVTHGLAVRRALLVRALAGGGR